MPTPPNRPPQQLQPQGILRDCGLTAQKQALLDPYAHRLVHLGIAAGTAALLGLAAVLITVPASRAPLGMVLAVAVVGFLALLLVISSEAGIALVVLGVPAYALWTLARTIQAADGPGLGLLSFTLAAFAMAYAAARGWRRFQCRRLGLGPIADLLLEVERYNRLVRAFDARQALAQAEGVPLDPEQHLRVSQTLNAIRSNLERAAAVAKVLRTHRDVLHGSAALLSRIKPFASVELESHAGHYGDILDQALQMAVAVQDELAHVTSRHG